LETVTDVRELSRRQVDALLLGFCAFLLGAGEPLLTVSPLPQRSQLRRHRLDGLREFGQLSGDARYVIGSRDLAGILLPAGCR
jgi:hypothetical protein